MLTEIYIEALLVDEGFAGFQNRIIMLAETEKKVGTL